MNHCEIGDCRDIMRRWIKEGLKVQMCVTSPPYWGGLRDYGMQGQFGLEREPHEHVARMVEVFRLVRDVLLDDGTLWLNIGNAFAASGKGGGGCEGDRPAWGSVIKRKGFRMPPPGFKMKDLVLIPAMIAEALRKDGWYLRQEIIWSKGAAIEPMRLDRPATSHEHLFLLSKAEHYFACDPAWGWTQTVWRIPTQSSGDPPQFPQGLVKPCILAGSRPGDIVLDPFMGSGTTGQVAQDLGRRWLGCELNPAYAMLQADRTRQQAMIL